VRRDHADERGGDRVTTVSPPEVSQLAAAIADAAVVVPVGAGTHREVGGPVPTGTEVRAPAGVVAYDPAELTITAGAGTTVAALSDALDAAGQMCPLDPRDDAATVGGVIASGLSGHRRLRYGPLRDAVLEVRLVTADGKLVRGGAPVVKNVTGYDLPRLIVGSLGTLAVIAQATLRCRPRPATTVWANVGAPPDIVRARVFSPSTFLWDGTSTHMLFEGDRRDVDAQIAAAGATVVERGPAWPDGTHRGRVSVRPGAIVDLGDALDAIVGCRWIAEGGVGTVHVATDTVDALTAARLAAHAAGGWLLREAGGEPGFDGFGRDLPDRAIARRLKDAFDPTGKLSPGRLPL
jgi:glycolate oxidase FAD binding subunit